MTKVTISRKNGHIIRIECDGHTDYGVKGEDIVCAALSSVVQTALLGLLTVAAIQPDYNVKDEEGYLSINIPDTLTDEQRKTADIILETMFMGVADLNEGYSDFVELTMLDK